MYLASAVACQISRASQLAALGSVAALSWASPTVGATTASYNALDKASADACMRASGLRNPRVGALIGFSDAFLIDARTVTGIWPQAHMKDAKTTMLCLYNRRTKRAETQEVADVSIPAEPSKSAAASALTTKDLRWHAEDIGGRGIVDRSEVTLMFGSDGKITGRSGCNQYSVNYMLTGTALKVYPSMIGTRIMCPQALMKQESRYQDILANGSKIEMLTSGAMTIVTADGRKLRFFQIASEVTPSH